MGDLNLRTVVRITTMANVAAAVDVTSPEVGTELVAAYERIREQARQLNDRAGWDDDASFASELPPVSSEHVPSTHAMSAPFGGPDAYQDIVRGRRARVLLGLLAAWAEGHQQMFELEQRFKADAEAKAKAAQPRRSPGFTPSDE